MAALQQQEAEPQQPQPPPALAAAAAGAPAQPARAAAQQQPPAEERPPGKCHFFMQKKRRYCKFDAAPGKRFCGNHLYEGEGTGPRRVPCPWDPKGGHTVIESELEKHKLKCPSYQQWAKARAQPFYHEGVNAGLAEAAVVWPEGLLAAAAAGGQPPAPAAAAPAAAGAGGSDSGAGAGAGNTMLQHQQGQAGQAGQPRPSALQAAYAASLGEQRFMQLLARIEAACEQICEAEPLRVLIPPAAEPLLLPDSATQNRPFSLKHAQQQASIVGNMQEQGLLRGAAGVTYVEYGAGKGYLSQMLGACTEASKIVMMDVRGFKQKADRGMRHLEMHRLRCDIKDFDVGQISGLEGGAAPWVAFGKHLCGAATDFTLRSCARELQRQRGQQAGQQGQPGQAAAAQQQQVGRQAEPVQPDPAAAAAGGATAGGRPGEAGGAALAGSASPAANTTSSSSSGGGSAAGGGVRGLAVATCCHHRCSWQHFVAKEEMAELGFSPEEFEVIAWMTGWALCGHEAPAGYGGGSDGEEQQEQQEAVQGQEQQQEGPRSAAAGSSGLPGEGRRESHKRGREEACPPAPPAPPAAHATAAAAAAAEAGAAPASPAAGGAPPHALPAAAAGPESTAAQERGEQEGQGGGRVGEWRPQWALPRDRKIAAGQRCKRLLDAARLRWLRRQGFASASLVQYVPASVSGENRLLLAVASPPPPAPQTDGPHDGPAA